MTGAGDGALEATTLRRGPRSVVVRGPEPGTVTKTFADVPGDPSDRRARTEHDRLDALYRALDAVAGATCPRPLRLEAYDGGWRLVMSEVPGEALHIVSGSTDRPDAGRVGANLAAGLVAYGSALGEPHYGLRANDILVTDAGEVALLDLEPEDEDRLRRAFRSRPAAAVSLGLLAGRVLHLRAAPHMTRRRRELAWALDVVVAAATQLEEGVLADVVSALRHEYDFLARSEPRWWRPAWYTLRRVDVVNPAQRRLAGVRP